MAVLPITAESLARLGANIEITAKSNYLPVTVESIVKIAAQTGAKVTIDAANYLPPSLESFVRLGGKNVTIRI